MAHAQKPSVDSEIHELNAEADFLEAKTTIVPHGVNGEDTKLQAHNSDPDAQAMVIESLRAQVQDLFSQVTQLNNKLVRSYDRVSDLEDELHVTSSNLRQTTLKISQLELERTQHLSALSTGLLVEKSHVTTELNRLMERATEEAARRGQAESARQEIEQELDDLSAGLFNQANTMVAEARMAAARSARKLEETETALRGAEEIVGVLQAQMQALQAEKEQANVRVEEMRGRMGKGKWVDRSPDGGRPHRPRLLSTHVPYHEFLVFISHLRAIRPASVQPPAMSTLLPLPLLARLVAEDSYVTPILCTRILAKVLGSETRLFDWTWHLLSTGCLGVRSSRQFTMGSSQWSLCNSQPFWKSLHRPVYPPAHIIPTSFAPSAVSLSTAIAPTRQQPHPLRQTLLVLARRVPPGLRTCLRTSGRET